MNIEDRVERLEKLVEKVLAEDELIGNSMSKLMDILIRYWAKGNQYRREMSNLTDIYRGEVENIDKQFQEHFKHHSHSDKKTPTKYKEYLS